MCAILVCQITPGRCRNNGKVSALLVEHDHSFILDTSLSSRPSIFWPLPGNSTGNLLLLYKVGISRIQFSSPVDTTKTCFSG